MCRRGSQFAQQREHLLVVLETGCREDLDAKLGGPSCKPLEQPGAHPSSLPVVGHGYSDFRPLWALGLTNEPRDGDDLLASVKSDQGFVHAMVDPREVLEVTTAETVDGM